MEEKLRQNGIRTVTVVGANGTMGRNVSAIFASFGHARVYMVSRSIEKSVLARNDAYKTVRAESIKRNLIPVDYSSLERCIAESDLVFESTTENWEIKKWVTSQIAMAAEAAGSACANTVFCTGTSGLSITELSKQFPDKYRGNYMGMHMFNPPYSMLLCEMTPAVHTNRDLFEYICNYCSSVLRRTVVEVKDSPAFLANRIGFQFINEALQYAERYKDNGGIDYIDAILGPFTGRSMAPLATSDFVGLDVHKAIVDNIYKNTNDFAHDTFVLPVFADELIKLGRMGRKAHGGLYQQYLLDSGVKVKQVWDICTGVYRNVVPYRFPFVDKTVSCLRVGDYSKAYASLKSNHSLEADVCIHFLLGYVLYALSATEIVGYDIHAADHVMAMGFNWCPPLAMIEAFGGIDEFEAICEERFDNNELCQGDIEHLLSLAKPSKYDYRKYMRAKR